MMLWRFFFFLLFTGFKVLGQEPAEKPPLNPAGQSKWEYDAFSYADLGRGEEHSYFSVTHRLNPKLYVELQVFYDTYTISNRLRAELRLQRYLTKKLFLFSGLQIEAETRVLPGNRILPPRLGVTGGLGYDVNDNFLLEVKGNFQINKSPLGVFGERQIRMPKVYTMGGKVRF